MRHRSAQLVRRVYEVDPLVCTKCGGEMRIVSVILDPAVITTILEHLRKKKDTGARAPPERGRFARSRILTHSRRHGTCPG